jgi:hypothetical protein
MNPHLRTADDVGHGVWKSCIIWNFEFFLTGGRRPGLKEVHARAQAKIIDMARHDANPGVRGESLFWLAQEAGKKVAGVISGAIEYDPNTEVKKRAVFALSEMPPDEGVPLLIQQAQKNANPVVRKEAMFWLGQSKDPRALDFITSVLER